MRKTIKKKNKKRVFGGSSSDYAKKLLDYNKSVQPMSIDCDRLLKSKTNDETILEGPRYISFYKIGEKKILLMGDTHLKYKYNRMSDKYFLNFMEIHHFLKNTFVRNKNKCIDMIVERPLGYYKKDNCNKPLTKYYQGPLEAVCYDNDLYNCVLYDNDDICKFNNLRNHNFDLRFSLYKNNLISIGLDIYITRLTTDIINDIDILKEESYFNDFGWFNNEIEPQNLDILLDYIIGINKNEQLLEYIINSSWIYLKYNSEYEPNEINNYLEEQQYGLDIETKEPLVKNKLYHLEMERFQRIEKELNKMDNEYIPFSKDELLIKIKDIFKLYLDKTTTNLGEIKLLLTILITDIYTFIRLFIIFDDVVISSWARLKEKTITSMKIKTKTRRNRRCKSINNIDKMNNIIIYAGINHILFYESLFIDLLDIYPVYYSNRNRCDKQNIHIDDIQFNNNNTIVSSFNNLIDKTFSDSYFQNKPRPIPNFMTNILSQYFS